MDRWREHLDHPYPCQRAVERPRRISEVGLIVSNTRFDVIVVGGGPAGSTAAYHLAESSSLDVLVVDKRPFPRHKTCGGALLCSRDWPAQFPNYAEIQADLCGHPNENLVFCVDRDVWWEGRDTHFFDHVHRYDFDALLLRAALERPGVSFRVFNVRSIERLDDRRLRLSDGTQCLDTRSVIGADGVSGVVSGSLGNPSRSQNASGVCLVHDVACEKPHEKSFVFYLWAGDPGYCYLFPTRDGYYVGAGFLGPPRRKLKQHLGDLMRYCVEQGLLPKKHRLRRTAGGLAPTSVVDRVADDGILLVGDAAGLLNQLSGEGIYYAMRSGQIAGRILSESFDQAAARYQRAVRPLLDDVTYAKRIRPQILGGVLHGYFGAARLAGWVGLGGHLKRPFINELLRRRHLPAGSHYQKLR